MITVLLQYPLIKAEEIPKHDHYIGDPQQNFKDYMTGSKISSFLNGLESPVSTVENYYTLKKPVGYFTIHQSPTPYNEIFLTYHYLSTQILIEFLN